MNKIFDPYRRKYVAATPEEEVRQWFCSFLTKEKSFPMVAIANECTININGLSQRCDTIVYKQGNPVMLVEYKAPSVKISQDVRKVTIPSIRSSATCSRKIPPISPITTMPVL